VTAVPFKAISQTTSAHVFNVPVPSLETIISREVLWTSKVTLKITNTNKERQLLRRELRGHRRPRTFPPSLPGEHHDRHHQQQHRLPEHRRHPAHAPAHDGSGGAGQIRRHDPHLPGLPGGLPGRRRADGLLPGQEPRQRTAIIPFYPGANFTDWLATVSLALVPLQF
jgi:hypothetical protein